MRGIQWVLSASLIGLMAAGCATTTDAGRAASAQSVSVDRLYRAGGVEHTRSIAAHGEAPFDARQLASYSGIEGARLAHATYKSAPATAEQFDGFCETSVKAAPGETLFDIAALCDVPLSELLASNPAIRNPRDLLERVNVQIPGAPDPQRVAILAGLLQGAPTHASGSNNPFVVYVSQPGDTLDRIAASHLVSADRVANLNPEIDWRRIPVGAKVRVPAPTTGVLTVKPGANAQAAVTVGADDSADEDGAARSVPSDEVSRLMPYRAGPRPQGGAHAPSVQGALDVNRDVIRPGGSVVLSAGALPPNAAVTISAGANRANLTEVAKTRTDAEGNLNARIEAPTGDAGGVVFRAQVDQTGQTLDSERVGVVTLKN